MDSTTLVKLKEVIEVNNIRVRVNAFGAGIEYPISLDVEHDEQGTMVCIGLYSALGEALIYTKIDQSLKETIEKADLIMHNGISDMECLRSWGINVKEEQLVHDTMLIGHIIDSSRKDYGLKSMAVRELNIIYPSYDEIVGKHRGKTKKAPACNKQQSECCGRVTLDKQSLELVAAYNALDCFVTYKLYQLQKKVCENYV